MSSRLLSSALNCSCRLSSRQFTNSIHCAKTAKPATVLQQGQHVLCRRPLRVQTNQKAWPSGKSTTSLCPLKRLQQDSRAQRHNYAAASHVTAASAVQPRLQRLVSHILVATYDANLLDEVEQRLKEGAEFKNLAPIYSECQASRMFGGSVGWLSPGDAAPAFEKAAFGARIGKLVRVETPNGLHLIKVEEEREQPAITEMSVSVLDEILQDANRQSEVQLIDVRERAEYDLVNLPQFELKPLSRIHEWEETVDEDLDPDKHTVIMCHHGIRSMRVALRLEALGFTHLSNVQGGIHAYTVKIDQSMPTY